MIERVEISYITLKFTCASARRFLPNDHNDVWICSTDGQMGQVCIMNTMPELAIMSCNTVCSSRITCIKCVPPYQTKKSSFYKTSNTSKATINTSTESMKASSLQQAALTALAAANKTASTDKEKLSIGNHHRKRHNRRNKRRHRIRSEQERKDLVIEEYESNDSPLGSNGGDYESVRSDDELVENNQTALNQCSTSNDEDYSSGNGDEDADDDDYGSTNAATMTSATGQEEKETPTTLATSNQTLQSSSVNAPMHTIPTLNTNSYQEIKHSTMWIGNDDGRLVYCLN